MTYATSLIAMDTIMLEYLKAMLRRQKRYLSRLTILQDGYKSLIIKKMQSNRLKTTLENIPSSVLMIDKHGEIVVANHAYYMSCLGQTVRLKIKTIHHI